MANFGDDKNSLKKENKDRENNTTLNKDREEKLRVVREKQNDERQRKLEELKAQAHAAQKFREQKEEERKRRIDDMKLKETDRRQQVEERKKAIWEAEKERREYILKKNQEREARIECKKKNEKSSIIFAFGSSTPRLLNSAEAVVVPPNPFWNHRRSTSITNVAFSGGNTLTRRSSERDLSDGPKKRATSASGLDRKNEDLRHMSASMYEVFNWSSSKDERPGKRYPLTIGPQIDIDNPSSGGMKSNVEQARGYYKGMDDIDSSPISYRSVARRKTDLMPTVPSPRDRSFYGSRSSLGSLTPRTPGRTMSMNRLDQLAQPRKRNGEHICAIIEREKRERALLEAKANGTNYSTESPTTKQSMSKSMINLHGLNNTSSKMRNKIVLNNKKLQKSGASQSMLQLATKGDRKFTTTATTTTTTTTIFKSRNEKFINRQKDAQPNENDSGLRSGEVTPGGSLTTASRPGSSMSNSVCIGVIQRRTPRKPRPVSIAGTGVTTNGETLDSKQKTDKPPLPKSLTKHSSMTKSPARSMQQDINRSAEKRTPIKTPRLASKPSSVPQSPLASTRTSKTNLDKQEPSAVTEAVAAAVETITEQLNVVDINETDDQNVTTQIEKTITVETNHNGEVQIKEESVDIVELIQNSVEHEDNVNNSYQPSIEFSEPETLIIMDTEEIKPQQESAVKPTLLQNPLISELAQLDGVDMSASFIAKNRINTEEEAKAALAERRRLAREEAERLAEIERLRIEEEERLVIQKQLEEEEEERRMEEEAHRLGQLQRKAEEERLNQAIEEVQKREEEERLKREEENRLKIEREESERKAREEAEKLRIETAERLKKEEKEREERRKRVEAIMARTRAKNTNKNVDNQNNENNESPTQQQQQQQTVVTPSKSPVTITNNGDANNSNTIVLEQTESTNNDISNQENLLNSNQNRLSSYESSVTEKENSLLGSFNNKNMDNVNKLTQMVVSHQGNGKLISDVNNAEIFIENHNGHEGYSISNLNGASIIDGKTTEIITDQLIDFSSAPHSIDELNNKSNNNNNNNNTSTLVTSDSQENRDLTFV